jgi:hypothetical protein
MRYVVDAAFRDARISAIEHRGNSNQEEFVSVVNLGRLTQTTGAEGICVEEYVYEYGKKSGENAVPTYSCTYSYTSIPAPDPMSVASCGSGVAG